MKTKTNSEKKIFKYALGFLYTKTERRQNQNKREQNKRRIMKKVKTDCLLMFFIFSRKKNFLCLNINSFIIFFFFFHFISNIFLKKNRQKPRKIKEVTITKTYIHCSIIYDIVSHRLASALHTYWFHLVNWMLNRGKYVFNENDTKVKDKAINDKRTAGKKRRRKNTMEKKL